MSEATPTPIWEFPTGRRMTPLAIWDSYWETIQAALERLAVDFGLCLMVVGPRITALTFPGHERQGQAA